MKPSSKSKWPYDESIRVAPYVCYSIEQAREELVAGIHRLELIIRRQEWDYDVDACNVRLERLRQTTPQNFYYSQLKWFEQFDDQGRPISSYNPNSKWDYYSCIVGLHTCFKPKSEAEGSNAGLPITDDYVSGKRIPHAIITPDGRWHEQGRLGLCATLLTENEHWHEDAQRLFDLHPGHRVVLLDAHI